MKVLVYVSEWIWAGEGGSGEPNFLVFSLELIFKGILAQVSIGNNPPTNSASHSWTPRNLGPGRS